ncbi:hypothetical protein ACUN0C_19055 [Faunimonas sp. B44]|uniref:hypothetical protein n=1 Tax=Faunimonas sp. B44 TaxID=3461493 RepID=UPI0040449ADE
MVTFSRELPQGAFGRSGWTKQKALELVHYTHDHSISLASVNSRGVSGSCQVSIPIEDIPALIQELEKFR